MATELQKYNKIQKQISDNAEIWLTADRDGDFDTAFKYKRMNEKLREQVRNEFEHVKVSFISGYRTFYKTVTKIGKTYFDNGEKMTKSRGFRCITEIEEITQDMVNEMISDTYYY